MTRTDYHEVYKLLLLVVIVYSRNFTNISIIVKENIMINRHNWLIVHPLIHMIATVNNINTECLTAVAMTNTNTLHKVITTFLYTHVYYCHTKLTTGKFTKMLIIRD